MLYVSNKPGSNAFARFSSKSLCEDVRGLSVRSARRVQLMLDSVPQQPTSTSSSAVQPARRHKKRSGYDMYVEEKKLEADLRGRSLKALCFTKEGRAELGDGWKMLSDETRLEYDMVAEEEEAKRQRLVLQAPSRPAIANGAVAETTLAVWAQPEKDTLLVLPRMRELPFGLQVATQFPLDAMATWHMGFDAPEDASVIKAANVIQAFERPLHVDWYQNVCLNHNDVGCKRVAVRKWTDLANSAALDPAPGDPNVIDGVNYEELCCGLCKEDVENRSRLAFRTRILKEMEQFCRSMCTRHKCQPVELAMHEFMMCFELKYNDRKTLVALGQISLSNAKSGPHKSFQGIISFAWPKDIPVTMAPDAPFRLQGSVVEPKFKHYVEPSQRYAGQYLDSHGIGRMEVYTIKRWCNLLLDGLNGLREAELHTTSLIITLCTHIAVMDEWNARRITGVDPTWPPSELPVIRRREPRAHPAPVIADCIADDDFALLLPPVEVALEPEAPPLLALDDDEASEHGPPEPDYDDNDSPKDSSDSSDSDLPSSMASDGDDDDNVRRFIDYVVGRPNSVENIFIAEHVKEDDGWIYALTPSGDVGDRLGRLAYVAGRNSLSMIGTCFNEAHTGPDGHPCFVMINATNHLFAEVARNG